LRVRIEAWRNRTYLSELGEERRKSRIFQVKSLDMRGPSHRSVPEGPCGR
jgi:hypothetical protein